MKKEEIIEALINSPVTYWLERDRRDMQKMSKSYLKEQYNMLEEAEEEYYQEIYD